MRRKSIKETVKGAYNDAQHHQNNAHPKTCPFNGDGVQLTNAQWHMAPISISWYRESWTMQLKC